MHEPVQRQVGRRALEQLGRALLKCHSVQPLSNPYTVWDPELETSTVEVTSTQAKWPAQAVIEIVSAMEPPPQSLNSSTRRRRHT